MPSIRHLFFYAGIWHMYKKNTDPAVRVCISPIAVSYSDSASSGSIYNQKISGWKAPISSDPLLL